MSNPDNQHYNLLSRSISPLAEYNTNNPNSSSLGILPIESDTSMRNEDEPKKQFRKIKRNNPDNEKDE
jgi:hypothetical protein